jgi:hypothetical protein
MLGNLPVRFGKGRLETNSKGLRAGRLLHYNKRMKELKKQLPKEERERATRQMERITDKRNRRIQHSTQK